MNRFAKYTSEIAEAKIGNKFDMILVAAARARELRRGRRALLDGKDGAVIMSLREIEAGVIGREMLLEVGKPHGIRFD